VDVSPDVDDASGVDVSPDADVSPDVDVPDGPPAIGAWSALPPLPRGPRQENAVLALDGALYVLGGFQGLQVSPLVEVYEPALGRWRDGEALPTRMHHLNAAVWEGQLYVLGFLTETSFTPDGRAFRYDPQEGVWSPLASMPRGAERGAGVAAALGERIYVVGGLRGGAVADVSAYDPASDTWSARAPLPEPLDHLVGGVVGGTLMVAGGRDGGLRSHTSALYAYDPRADRWEAKTPMPTSRAGHAAAVWDGRLYVFGGEGNPDDPSGVFPQTEVYDPANDTWSPLAPMPTPRHGTGAATLGATLYVPGGADVQGFGAVDTFEAFMPAPR
jgi:N-acetylneuraminic acid mutarotase